MSSRTRIGENSPRVNDHEATFGGMRRFFSLLAVLVLAVGCAGVPLPAHPPGPETQVASLAPAAVGTAPRLGRAAFIAADGAELPLRAWLPEGEPRAVILALHGFNDYSNAFAMPAPSWAAAGIATYAYDQRGFGGAPGRGRWAGAAPLAADAITAARLLRARHPDVPLYLLGESMGGAVSMVAATASAKPPVDGLVLVAPAVWGRQTMNVFQRAGLWFASLMPSMRVSASSLPVKVRASDNIAMLRAFSADPLVIKDTRTEAVTGLVDVMGAALEAAPRLQLPTLILYGEHDEIVPRHPVARMVARLPLEARARQKVALYPNGWHMLLRDLGGAVPARDIAAWVLERGAPLPSGADRDARYLLTGEPPTVAAVR
jgi:alpha-beta hydrolase superfamily lysophospholipase